jgi:hypothetical protein
MAIGGCTLWWWQNKNCYLFVSTITCFKQVQQRTIAPNALRNAPNMGGNKVCSKIKYEKIKTNIS